MDALAILRLSVSGVVFSFQETSLMATNPSYSEVHLFSCTSVMSYFLFILVFISIIISVIFK